ncbi:MAG TPA: FAD-dependent oxidoreductase [Bryobacteraceae bacterium]|jgi:2-polyprenyl-6-methoxyphenol hydroxylase-like FAD-dependent oxidoreductase|nr:FAD-dependent oxidoreductase [Bryobacteraceae bacterium]
MTQEVRTQCCIAGGGPAGMVLGFLLARAGVSVVVFEKHADFLRDFRGDTIHPSTLELLYELGLLDEFLRRPHQEVHEIGAQIEDSLVTIADLSHLPTHCKFVALMPQWDFLNFIAEKARRYPKFELRMECEATGLIEESGRIVGARVMTKDGALDARADLTIGADGRRSTVRREARLQVKDLGAPIDVLWMRISKHPEDPNRTFGRVRGGKILVTLDRGDYWQCAYVVRKGEFDAIRARGLASFQHDIAAVAPPLSDRVGELADWKDISLLSVAVDRLVRWHRPGLLCIGDSAHAMSPVGGVGINLAIQDAVAAANILAEPLARGAVKDSQLEQVQKRREFPTRVTQAAQVQAHKRLLEPTLSNHAGIQRLPLGFRLLQRFPVLRRIPARLVGIGVRPEHIRT